jgi:transcriptional regulator with XRE-family HTH domain
MIAMEPIRTHPAVEAINDLLHERGIGRSELARLLGWERMTVVRRLTIGRYSTDLTVPELEQIAAALGVPVSRFLPDTESATDSPATAGAGGRGNGPQVAVGDGRQRTGPRVPGHTRTNDSDTAAVS